jgi:chitodextrinase
MLRLASTAIAALVLLLGVTFARAPTAAPLPGFNVDVRETSVSGLSSGGFMAVQFDVAFSSFVKGAGIVAGGPYYCARGDVQTATSVCSCVPFGCFMPGMIDTPALIRITDQNAGRGLIDPVANLARHRIWLFSGTADTAVPPRVMNELDTYYRNYIDPSQIAYENRIPAEHAQPTDDFGSSCGTRADPYINDCDYDGAGQLLRWIYGPLSPRNDGALDGSFVQFDQTEFLANSASHGMDTTGWAYVPAACREGEPCRLHVVFHGCQQYQSRRYFQPGAGMTTFGTTYVRNAGYNEWADSNNIVVLYPQAIASSGNPNGCWDWWGYDDPNYALKSGRQMATVKGMVDRVTAGFVSLPAPAGLRVTATTDSSVTLGWDAVSAAAGFNLYRNGRKVNAAPIGDIAFTDTGLAPGTSFSYAVAAVGTDGREGARSATIAASTTGTAPPVPAPTGLRVDTVGQGSVALSWTAAVGVAGYDVLRGRASGGPYAPVNQSPISATTFTDGSVTPATTFFYVVRSVSQSGAASTASNEVSATTAAAPVCFTATNYDHVRAGRARNVLGIARANGSNQSMGLFNIFIVTTLRQTGPNAYVVGTCPA